MRKEMISWFKKIKARDFLQSSEGTKAEMKIEEIRNAFESYSELAYRNGEKG